MVLLKKNDKANLLESCPLFQGLSKRQLSHLADQAFEVTVPPNKVIVKQGTLGQQFFVVIEGSVHIEENGKLLGKRSQGAYFGEIALLDDGRRTASVLTDTEVHLLSIKKEAFRKLLEEVPGLKDKIILALCRYLRIAENSLLGTSKSPFPPMSG